ncbi:MAG: transglycosylase SLT domain-containing protein [Ignisphaera sp.]|nr:transglycosylase SLT domain-containing protein [Ignisphaera sp.]
MSVLELFEKKIRGIIKLNALTAILAPILVAGAGVWAYQHVMAELRLAKDNQSLVLVALEKQGLPGKLLKVVDEKLDAACDAKEIPHLPSETKVEVTNTLLMMCAAKNIRLNIVLGLIEVESGWYYKATSEVGAKGLMQVMPATAKPYLRVERKPDNPNELYNPVTAIIVGLSYFADLQTQYVDLGVTEPTNYTFALHSYFWGGANSAALLGKKDTRVNVPNFSYPLRVMAASKQYKDMGF